MDFDNLKDAVIYESICIGGGSLVAAATNCAINMAGLTLSPWVGVGVAVAAIFMMDKEKISLKPSTKVSTYEGIASTVIFLGIDGFRGFPVCKGGISGLTSVTGTSSLGEILNSALQISSLMAAIRATYFTAVIASHLEPPEL